MKSLLLLPALLCLGLRAALAAPAGAPPPSVAPPSPRLVAAEAPAKATAAAAKPAKDGTATAFIRRVDDEEGEKLQTAVVSYESPKGIRVELVGAVHIADKAYFDTLNQRFKRYDAVLYELVGPPMDKRDKATMEKEAKDRSRLAWVGTLQRKMKETLQLHGQLECIDYKAKNFVHADMDTSQFTDTQTEKKESFFGLYLKAAMAQKEAQAKTGVDSDTAGMVMLLKLLTAKDSSTGLKRMLAQQFETVGDIMSGMEAGNGTVIVGERNRVALEVMDKQIAAGKKNLAIFYGAAHLGDMETRLKKRDFKKVKTEWLTAWDIPNEE